MRVPLIQLRARETDLFESFSAKFPQKLVEVLEKHEAELVEESISFDYDYWTSGELNFISCVIFESSVLKASLASFSTDQILQAVLPEELLADSPSAFTQVGHIGMPSSRRSSSTQTDHSDTFNSSSQSARPISSSQTPYRSSHSRCKPLLLSSMMMSCWLTLFVSNRKTRVFER